MCGIAGWCAHTRASDDDEILRRMGSVLSHRGPDDYSAQTRHLATNANIAMANSRLAVLDISSAAAQPMMNEEESVLLSYNGEIYNFRELRGRLQARGHRFRSHGDTEVLVHTYEEYGEDFVSHLDGMFAFALWDDRRQTLILARDRAGKKPLYYTWDGKRLTFASEIKALRVCPWVQDDIAWDKLPEMLTLGYVPWPDTLFRNILQVPPGCTVRLNENRLSKPKRYWQLHYPQAGVDGGGSPDWDEAAARVLERLRDAVCKRLVSDVPLGVLLSGGLDSSSIVALMDSLGADIRTFSVGVEGNDSYDERSFARIVAEQYHTNHTELIVRAEAWALLNRLIWHLDQPMADSSAVPTYLISQAAREHVTVVLTGDGGDEVFGGYERFMAALLADRLPLTLQRVVGGLAGMLPSSSSYFGLRRRLERFSVAADEPLASRYLGWVSIFDPVLLDEIVKPEIAELSHDRSPASSFDVHCDEAGRVPLLHRLLYANFYSYLHDDLLVKVDRMSMANSLEARCPFLDTQLMEEVAALPPSMKATPFGTKRVLKKALKGLVPDKIISRRKHGFGIPVDQWFRAELKNPFRDVVLGADARVGQALDVSVISKMFGAHQKGGVNHGSRLWSLLALELWLRMLERPPDDRPPEAAEPVASFSDSDVSAE